MTRKTETECRAASAVGRALDFITRYEGTMKLNEGLGNLGERLRVAAANDDWRPNLHEFAERLAGLGAEQRSSVWADVAGVGSETIGRRVTSMAKIVGDLVVCLEANQADSERNR